MHLILRNVRLIKAHYGGRAIQCNIRDWFSFKIMIITIYHNRHCSKSREALDRVTHFAKLHQQEVSVVDYLATPLSFTQLQELQRQLGVSVRDLVRTNEEEYKAQRLDQADEHGLLQAVAATPKLLQRPIVVVNERAIIARPPELLDTFLPVSR